VYVQPALALAHSMLILRGLEHLSKESDSGDDFDAVCGLFRINNRTPRRFPKLWGSNFVSRLSLNVEMEPDALSGFPAPA